MAIRIKKPKIGITLRLFLLFAAVGLIPISFMSFYTFWQINRQVAFEVENNMTNVGLRLREDVGRSLEEVVRIAEAVAADPVFSSENVRGADIGREMGRIRKESPRIKGLYLLKGREVLSSVGPPVFVSGDPDILDFSVTSLRVAPPRPFPDNGNPAFLISIPIAPESTTAPTVLLIAVDTAIMKDAVRLIRIGETGRTYVTDDSGDIVAGPTGTDLFEPFGGELVSRRIATVGEGIIHYTNELGQRNIAFVATVPDTAGVMPRGLKVLVTYREEEAYLIADQIGKSVGFAIIMILVATSLFSFALSRTITRPIKEIIRGTERIGAGDFSREITVRSRDEIGDLARSFNRMAWELSASRQFMENYNRELERKVRERSRELEESEKKYRMLVEGSGDGWTILDEALTIHFANEKLGRMLGRRRGKLVGMSLAEFLSPAHEKRVREATEEVVRKTQSPLALSFEINGPDGRPLIIGATFSAIETDEPEARVVAHLVDQTELALLSGEKERLQLELMERSKHSQIGIMTEGLFHNLNNPLQALIGILRVVSQDIGRVFADTGKSPEGPPTEDGPQIVHDVGEAYAISRRLSDQVKNLLMKIRNESRRKVEELDLNRIIQAEVAFLEADLFFKHKVVKKLSLAERLPPVAGVYSDISQSFVNVILNATDAMRESSDRVLTITTSLEKKKIAVAFHDTGKGIDEADVPHIFDPFFSTKHEKEQGTGLGLFTVDFLLKPYKVTYRVRSRPGDTTIVLLFPVKGPGGKKAAAPTDKKTAPGGRKKKKEG
ncbi:MAG: HAMP domain-containing protein [Deltaproteobacteria bacterium]|nr:HAMP domain-containing protein [Candidatus Zymogenaceae bacterium]